MNMISQFDQKQKHRPSPPTPEPDSGGGPISPKIEKPNVDAILKKMKSIDRDGAKRYRQRTGQ